MRFAYTRPDGGVSIVNAAPKEALERVFGKLTDEQYRGHVLARSIPSDATNVTELPGDWQPPHDRTFRNAWRVSDGKVEVDMAAARELHKDELRLLRAPKLAALDVEFMRSLEAGDTKATADITSRKQALRDVTADAAIEAAKTPDELKSVLPDALK